MATRKWRLVMIAAVLCALAALPLRGQDDDEEEQDPHAASIDINIRQSGAAWASLYLPTPASNPTEIAAVLGGVFHCSPAKFGPPPAWRAPKGSMAEAQRQRYEKAIEESRARRVQGECGPVTQRAGLLYSGQFDFAPLLRALQAQGVETLAVELSSPRAAWTQFSSEQRSNVPTPESWSEYSYASYQFSTTAGSAQIAVQYGYRRSDLQRMVALSLAYVLVPLAILLWIRRSVLRSAGDPTDAWFSYFRTMKWCVNGSVLLWCLTRLSPLRELLQFFTFAGLHGISGSLATMGVILAPPAALYAAASFASYKVFARFRGATVSRREYVLGQLLQLGTVFLPLNLLIGGAMLAVSNPRAGVVLMVLAVVVLFACADWRMRIMRSTPMPVTSGELRDRIFALAGKVGVKVKQVFIMPAARVQMANAFAARNGIVMFTDYLLQRLDKREVDAIAAHELTHLRHKHPAKLGMILLGVILLPSVFSSLMVLAMTLTMTVMRLAGVVQDWRTTAAITSFAYRFDQSAWRDVIWFSAGFLGFYLLARRFEKTADLGAVNATGDGAALITGLVKVSSLNLMPLRWGRVTGATLTHPSTMRRLEYIAAACNIAETQLKELVTSASAPAQPAAATYSGVDGQAVEAGSARALQTARSTRKKVLILIAMHVLPATIVALLAQWLIIVGTPGLLLKVLGIALTIVLYAFTMHWLGLRDRAQNRRLAASRIEQSGVKLDTSRCTLVGFSPGPNPRHYIHSYDWDRGFLLLARGRLHFVGEQTRFALEPRQIDSITLGPGAPSWFNFPRVYVDWRDDAGEAHSFSFSAAEPCAMSEIRQRIDGLHQRLTAWLQNVSDQVRPPEGLENLTPPEIGEVTCMAPREVTSFGKFVGMYVVLVIPAAIMLTLLLRLEMAFFYIALTGLLVRFYESIPYWRYRDRVPVKAQESRAAAQVASAS